MKPSIKYLTAFIGLAAIGLICDGARAQSATLVPFDQFFNQVSAAQANDYVGKPASPLTDAGAFEDMRRHIVSLYSNVHVRHSYLLGAHPYDCVPIEQQPSVRLQKLHTIASPPAQPIPFPGNGSAQGQSAPPQIDPAQTTDPLGNKIGCEDGTIPMRRVMLEDVSRFKTLSAFFQKGPQGAGQLPNPSVSPAIASIHKYAHSYQFVANVGGASDLSLWNPAVYTNLNEIFSLSQFWISNNNGPVQTMEAGLQNYPQKYNNNNTVLFIYWTSDGYNSVGCYNLDCPGFVQTNKNIHLGSGFSSYSNNNGGQYYVTLEAFFYNGNWWLYYGGGNASNIVGYYPGSVYHGQPMASGANEVDFGGEVVGSAIWPQMGSGKFAATGFGHAAFHKNIAYFADTTHAYNANLTVDQASPSCFTDVTHDNSGISGWNTFFFFGGPGGKGC